MLRNFKCVCRHLFGLVPAQSMQPRGLQYVNTCFSAAAWGRGVRQQSFGDATFPAGLEDNIHMQIFCAAFCASAEVP